MRALPDKPEQQVSLFDSRGHFLGRADFFWRSLGVVGEADGREKYVGDELWREKQREARMVRRGILIVRWDWATAMNPAQCPLGKPGSGFGPPTPILLAVRLGQHDLADPNRARGHLDTLVLTTELQRLLQ